MSYFDDRINCIFPLRETFTDLDGNKRTFDIYLREITNDEYLVEAKESIANGLSFDVYLDADPDVDVDMIRCEINSNLSSPAINHTAYFEEEDGFFEATIESDGMRMDGHHISMQELTHLLPAYEGANIKMVISR